MGDGCAMRTPKARRHRRWVRREADPSFDQGPAKERSESLPEPPRLRQLAEPSVPEARPRAERVDFARAQRGGLASDVEGVHVKEPLQRPGDMESSTEIGIRHRSTDGTTEFHTGARGLPGIFAHTHLSVVALIIGGFVAALLAIVMVVRELRPDRTESTERNEGASRYRR